MSVDAEAICDSCKVSAWIGKLKANGFCLVAEDFRDFLDRHIKCENHIRIVFSDEVPSGYKDETNYCASGESGELFF